MKAPTRARSGAIVKIIWALVWAGQLVLLLAGDNQLKCLCVRADELSGRAQLLSLGGDTNKQVIGDNESAGEQLEDNRQSATSEEGDQHDQDQDQDDGWTEEADQRDSADDLRAAEWSGAGALADVTIPIIDNQKATRVGGAEAETNPLIGARPDEDGTLGAPGHYRLIEGAPEPAAGDESSFLFHHRAARKCPQQADCEPAEARHRKQAFCASDGRLYESLCAMRRNACQLNITLHRMKSLAHCQRLKWPLKTSDNLPALPPTRTHSSGPSSGGHQTSCSRGDYEQFKLALWHEFNQNAQLMFNYFDLDGNQVIEARELWPRHQFESSSNASSRPQTDFLFEPHFHWSHCALSHLMLYELQHEGDKFDLESFERMFSQFSKTNKQNARDRSGSNEVKSTRQIDTTRIHLRLGDSQMLSCLSRQLESDLRSALGGNSQKRASCFWSRRGTNLASLRDEHIRLVPVLGNSEPPATNHHAAKFMLHLRDAQLYLSGDYECACKLDAHLEFIHKFRVQVTVEPHVSVAPQFQWSLPGSRVSLECQHDFIDTIADAAKQDLHKGQQIDWFRIDNHTGRRQMIAADGAQLDRKFSTTNPQNDLRASYWPRASISMASSRLILENLQANDTASYECRARVPLDDGTSIESAASGRLLVQDEASPDLSAATPRHHLWRFHEGGISVFRVNEDEGQELESVRELSGHHEIRAEVDGNWNQLTLCGGLNPEQAVICEWSDNAVELRVAPAGKPQRDERPEAARSYIYVGQPNLNRLLVLDGRALAIVAVVNTEPQPRKLFAFRPNKIHLSKWLRRRLSPLANARWLQAIERSGGAEVAHQWAQQQAHPLELTPKSSRLYSDDGRQQSEQRQPPDADERAESLELRVTRQAGSFSGNQRAAPKLVQYDIWLLCYGQPLVVDPAGSESADDEQLEARNRSAEAQNELPEVEAEPRANTWPLMQTHFWLADAGAREARLRNRKSIQIIQSTFFAQRAQAHTHAEVNDIEAGVRLDDNEQQPRRDWPQQQQQQQTGDSLRAVNEFKRLSVLTTHYVMAGQSVSGRRSGAPMSNFVGRAGPIDLVQDLSVPSRPESLIDEAHLKLHYAYAMHYEQRQLYRIAMDSYHYDRQLDLADCDPTSLLATLQGQLVVQCRAFITHKPLGQLLLDELTGAKIHFNPNIYAQDNYLSPDSNYLISVFNNQTEWPKHSTVIYVQLVGVHGLAFQYEIKTTLEIVQCSFVWKDGYYAAVFVAINRRDQQSELLSLRLADSRLELMVRVPGLVQLRPRHRQPLNILHKLKLASLSTSEGTHIVDLDENRIIQTLRQHHQSGPTLLWT